MPIFERFFAAVGILAASYFIQKEEWGCAVVIYALVLCLLLIGIGDAIKNKK